MKKWKRILWIGALSLFSIGILVGAAIYILVMTDVFVKLDEQRLTDFEQTTQFFDRNGELAAQLHAQNRIYVALKEIPKEVQDAFIAAEDLRFYQHHGIDPVRILGALAANVKSGVYSQGASTITQQLVKNTHLSHEKTLSRKLKEIVLALKTEQRYEKEKILELYLNCIYFGNGAYGIQAAAHAYFDKDAAQLSLAEGAALAATLKAPSNYAPHVQPENNRTRRESILSTMAEEGMISDHAAQQAMQAQLTLTTASVAGTWAYGWYMDAVLTEAEKLLSVSADNLITMGLHIHTALDPAIQDLCDALYLDDNLFPDNATDGTPCQSAFVVMEAETGDVLAMVGGRQYEVRRGFNRVTQAKLQPGSVLKPLAVYAPALERRIATCATVFTDEAVDFEGYRPKNYGGRFYGHVTLREAVADSLNIAPVVLLDRMGVQTGRESLMRFHLPIHDEDQGLSLAIGSMTEGLSPLSLCAAYASLAVQGTYHSPVLITKICNAQGEVLYRHTYTSEIVMQPAEAFVLTNLLTSTVQFGTAKQLQEINLPIAAKTGTVGYDDTHNRDVWSVAYTPRISVVCWMGFDHTDSLHSLPSDVTGGKQPTALLKAFLERLNLKAEEFAPPQEGIVYAALDKLSMQIPGEPLLAGAYTLPENTVIELFLEGTQPTAVSDLRILPKPPLDIGIEEGKYGFPVIRFTVQQDDVLYHLYRVYGSQTHEAAQLSGKTGDTVMHTDTTAQRLFTYDYYIVPEDTRTGVLGDPSPSIPYTVPLGMDLFDWLPFT